MLDLLKESKEALEARGKKGFTLMEMLIVIAIIAILIAIAIPLFSTQLETARDSTSVANIRSAYAQAQAAWLTQKDDTANGVTLNTGAGTVTVANVTIESQSNNDWSNQAAELPDPPFAALKTADPGSNGKYTLTISYENGTPKTATLAKATS